MLDAVRSADRTGGAVAVAGLDHEFCHFPAGACSAGTYSIKSMTANNNTRKNETTSKGYMDTRTLTAKET